MKQSDLAKTKSNTKRTFDTLCTSPLPEPFAAREARQPGTSDHKQFLSETSAITRCGGIDRAAAISLRNIGTPML